MRTLALPAISLLVLIELTATTASAAERTSMTYRTVGGHELQALIVSPDGHGTSARAPAVVFFHGGGWRGGSPETGLPYAEFLADHGVVTLAMAYRLTDAATLDEIIVDAQSAIRWTRENARRRLGIDPGKIVAFGHSAGGHLAGSTAILESFEETDSYTSVSARPNALAMIAPYPATEETAGEHLRAGARIADYEPRLHLNSRVPPTLIIQGSEDELVRPSVSSAYHDALVAAGVNSTLFMVEGVDHFFREDAAKAQVGARLLQFLTDLGYFD